MDTNHAQGPARGIAFVLNNVQSYERLVAALEPGVEVHVLDASQDGLAQIAAIVAGRSEIGALHIVGHGSKGSLNLGALTLDAANIGAHRDVLGKIGDALAQDGDILLYGCDVASDALGLRFIGLLAEATAADVAASTDATGSAARGGDWVLEHSLGQISAAVALDAAVSSLDTLLALPPDGPINIGDEHNGSAGTAISIGGFFKMTATKELRTDPDAADGVFIAGAIAGDPPQTITVEADGDQVGSFDLEGMNWLKYFDAETQAYDGTYTFNITGYKLGGGTVTTSFNTVDGSSAYSSGTYAQFTNITKFTIEIVTTSAGDKPSANTFDSFSIANAKVPNRAPTFTDTTTPTWVLNHNSTGLDLVSLLAASDADSDQTLTWTQKVAPAHGTLSISGNTAGSGSNVMPGGTFKYIPAAGYAGTDTFTVEVRDDANVTAEKTFKIVVKPAPPSTPDLSAGSDAGTSTTDNLTNASALSLSGTSTAADGTTVRVFVDGNGNGIYDDGEKTATTTASSGSWTVSGLSTAGLADGNYSFYAQTEITLPADWLPASQVTLPSDSSTPLSITIDKTAPTVAIASSKSTLVTGETANITFTFSEDPGSTFTWDGASGDLAVNGGTLSAISGSGNTRTATFTAGAASSATITVASLSYADQAGNNGGTGTITLILDTTPPLPPAAPVLDPGSDSGVAGDSVTSDTTPTLTGSAEAGSTVTIHANGSAIGTTTAAGNGSWSFTPVSARSNGTHNFTATATDAAGNTSEASSPLAITVDTIAPTLAITSDRTDFTTGDTATISLSFSEVPNGFSKDDIAVTGGTLGDLAGSGTSYSIVFTPTPGLEGAGSIEVAANKYADVAGNNGAGAAIGLTIDTLAPTVTITSNVPKLKADETASITFTFSEDPGASFDFSDITADGGTLGSLIGTGTVRTATFTPTPDIEDGAATITVTGSFTDLKGNQGAAAGPLSLTYDTLAPTAPSKPDLVAGDDSGLSSIDNFTSVTTPTFTGTADDGVTVTLYDGATQIGTGTAAGGTWTITSTSALGDGDHNITAKATDDEDNTSTSAPLAVTVNTGTPELSITSSATELKADETATITFTFTADPGENFTRDDIVVSGGTLGDIAGTGTTRTALFTPAAGTNAGSASISVAAAAWVDLAGNAPDAAATLAITYDTLKPTLDITSDVSSLKAGDTATITLTFSEDPGASFDLGDITASGGTLGTLTVTGTKASVEFTPLTGINGGTASISVGTGDYTDDAGNSGSGDTLTLSYDTAAPVSSAPVLAAASDSGSSNSDRITNSATLVFEGTAEEGAQVMLVDATTDAQLGTAIAAAGGKWSISLADAPAGTLGVAAIVTDAAGNVSAKSSAATVTVDRTGPAAPTLALESDTGTSGSDAVTKNGTVQVSGLEAGAAWQYSVDNGTTWLAGSGTELLLDDDGEYAIVARQIDEAGNTGTASAPLDFAFDSTAPHASVTLDRYTIGKNQTAKLTIDFGEKVSGFGIGNISVENGTLGADLATADDGRTWTVTFTPDNNTSDSDNVVRVTNTGVMDVAGNAGTGTSDSPNYQVRTTGPASDIVIADTELKAGETTTVTIEFSEAVNGFTVDDIAVENGTLTGLSSTDNKSWTAQLTPSANVADSTNVITIDNSGVTGQVSGGPGGGATTSANYVVSTVRPTVASIALADALLSAGDSTTVTIVFSEPISGLDLSDLTAVRGTLSDLATTDNITWTVTFTAGSSTAAALGRVTVSMPGVQNAAGNAGGDPVSSPTYVVLPTDAPPPGGGGTSGGIPRQPFTDPVTGLPNELVNIPATPPGGSAQVNLGSPGGSGGTGSSLTANLPGGAGMEVSGPVAPLTNAQALQDLIARIESTTTPGATQTHMTGLGQVFLGSLDTGAMLETRTITPTVAPGTSLGQPIVISGTAAQPGSNAPVAGLVIDGSGLPAGTTLQLDNVGFAAVMGDLRLVGGAGSNFVVGDGGSQVIYLGPDDDILSGGAGNDFIGSGGGDDQLDGGADNDLVAGGAGNDKVLGGAGADVLNGGRSTMGGWNFYLSASGNIVARHSGAVFAQGATELVQAAELDASVPELGFLGANAQQLVGVSLLYAALGRAPDLAGLTYWSRPGMTLNDVANGVLASTEWLNGPLGQLGNEAYVREIYKQVLGRTPDTAGLAYWVARLDGTEGGRAASRTEVLASVALSDEHRAASLTADGFAIGTASLSGEAGWFTGSGNDRLDGGAGNDQLVGGDGFDTAVFAGQSSDYRVVMGSDHKLRVVHGASGDVDTLSGIEAAEFGNGTLDLTFLNADPAMVDAVGLLYQAVFDRAGDAGALNWWLSHGMGKPQLAQAFTQTAEFQSRFGAMNDAAFVQALYANSGLDLAAAGGVKSWEAYLASHTRAELVATWISHDSVINAQFGNGGLWLL